MLSIYALCRILSTSDCGLSLEEVDDLNCSSRLSSDTKSIEELEWDTESDGRELRLFFKHDLFAEYPGDIPTRSTESIEGK